MKISVFYDHILQAAEQTGKPLAELLRNVKNAGIEAVEINMSYLCQQEQTYALLKEAGLKVSCVYEFYEMGQQDECIKAKKHIDIAKKAGAEKILVVPGFFEEQEAEQLAAYVGSYEKTAVFLNENEKALRMAEGLNQIAEWGKQMDIAVTVEDFDDRKSPLSCVGGMLWFVKQVPLLKVTFYAGNFIIHGEYILSAWAMLKEQVVHIQCTDRGTQPVAVGDGYIPMHKLIEKIRTSRYDEYLAIEHFDAKNQEQCMEKSAAFLKKEWTT